MTCTKLSNNLFLFKKTERSISEQNLLSTKEKVTIQWSNCMSFKVYFKKIWHTGSTLKH